MQDFELSQIVVVVVAAAARSGNIVRVRTGGRSRVPKQTVGKCKEAGEGHDGHQQNTAAGSQRPPVMERQGPCTEKETDQNEGQCGPEEMMKQETEKERGDGRD